MVVPDKTTLWVLAGIGAGIGVATAGGLYYYNKKPKEVLPEKWVKVAEVADILYYPLKSCQPVHDVIMNCEPSGLSKFGINRDRVLVIIDEKGKAVTARQYPPIVLIDAKFKHDDGVQVVLKVPETENYVVSLEKLDKRKKTKVSIWGDIVDAIDCGDEAAKWISTYVLQKPEGFRIVAYPSKQCRPSKSDVAEYYPKITRDDFGAYSDMAGYMLLSEESVDDLNKRLENPVPPKQFRPNIVIKGAAPYAEDSWDYVKIGDVIFRNIKRCTRCVFTTINPETGTKDDKGEPLKTLRSYRKVEDPILAKYDNYAPRMGVNLGLRRKGTIAVGMPVYINSAS